MKPRIRGDGILVVDDDLALGKTLTSLLKQAGLAALEAVEQAARSSLGAPYGDFSTALVHPSNPMVGDSMSIGVQN